MSGTENRKMSQINAINAVETITYLSCIAVDLGVNLNVRFGAAERDELIDMLKAAIAAFVACIEHYDMNETAITGIFNAMREAERTMYQ